MKSRFIFLALVGLICNCAFAYNFSAVCESGQTLYYNIISNTSPYTVSLTSENVPDTYTSDLVGDLIIPSTVTNGSRTYSVTSIGWGAFSGCSGLESVVIGASITSIGWNAFYSCRGLTSVNIPNSVTSIADGAFAYCSQLSSITIGDSVTSIGHSSFEYTAWYNDHPDGILYLGNWCMGYKGDAPSGPIVIDGNTKGIVNSAFSYCENITSITFPDSIKYIGYEAFYNCTGLTGALVIPNAITYIKSSTFSGCSNLTSLTIGSSVSTIEASFVECYKIDSISVLALNPPTIYSYSFEFDSISDIPLTVPCGRMSVYSNAEYWNNFTNMYENNDCVGIVENEIADLQVYPNPAGNILNITSSETISEIEIVNAMGQVVLRKEINAENAVCDVEGLANGIYVVRIQVQGSEIQRKFVKE